jgi:hypothetical protein
MLACWEPKHQISSVDFRHLSMPVDASGRAGVMARYRATIQVSGISGESPRAVRAALDERLRSSGLEQCHIVSVDLDVPSGGTARPSRSMDVGKPSWQRQTNAGGFLLVAAATWAVWFFWWMLSAGQD